MSHNNTTVFLFTVQGILASLTCGLCCLIYAYCCNNKNERNRNKRTISKVHGDTYVESATTVFKKSKVEKEAGSKSVHEDAATHIEQGVEDGARNTKAERTHLRCGNGSGMSHNDNYCKRNGSAKGDRTGTIPRQKSIQENYCHRRESKMELGVSNEKNGEMDKGNGEEERSCRNNCEGVPLNMRNANQYKDLPVVGIIPRNNSVPYDGRIIEKNEKCENFHNAEAGGSDRHPNWSNERKEIFKSDSNNMINMVVPPNRGQITRGEEQKQQLPISNQCRNNFNPHCIDSHISSNGYGEEDNKRILKIMQAGEKNMLSSKNNMSITVNRVEAKNNAICGLREEDAVQVAAEREDQHAYSRSVLDRQMVYYPNDDVFRVKSETLIRSYPVHSGASGSAHKGMNKYCPDTCSTRRRNCPEPHNHFTQRKMNGCEVFEDEEEKSKCRHYEHVNNYTPSKCINCPHNEESTNRSFVKCEKNVVHNWDKNVPNGREQPSVEGNRRVVPVIHKDKTYSASSEYNKYKYNDVSMNDTLYRSREPFHDMSHFNNEKEIKSIIENCRVEEPGTLSYDNDKATYDKHILSNNNGETSRRVRNVGHYDAGKGFNPRNPHLSNHMSTNLICGDRTKSVASYGLAYNQGENVSACEGEETPPKRSSPRLGRFISAQNFACKRRTKDREGKMSQGNRNNDNGNNDSSNDIHGKRSSNHNNGGEDHTKETMYYTRGQSMKSSMIDAVEMATKVPTNSCTHTNKTKSDANNCAHCSPLDEEKLENPKKKYYYQLPRDHHLGITECLPCKEGTHMCKNNNCPSDSNYTKQRNDKENNVYLKKSLPDEHVCSANKCNSNSWFPHCTEKISGKNESFFHPIKFEKNTKMRDISESFSQHTSYKARPFIMSKGLQQGGPKMVTKCEFSDDIYPLTDDNADYDGVESSCRGGRRSGNASGVRSGNVSSLLSGSINLGERCGNDKQKARLNRREETAIPIPLSNDELASGRRRRKKGTKRRGNNSKEEMDNQSNTPQLTNVNEGKLRQKEPSEYKSSQDINQIIHAYLQNSKKEYNYSRSDKSDREMNHVTDKYNHEGMHSHGYVSQIRKSKKKDSNDNMRYDSCRTRVVGNKKGQNGRDNGVGLAQGEITNSKSSSRARNTHEKSAQNEQTHQEEKPTEEDAATSRDRMENGNIQVKREKSDRKVLIKKEKDVRSGNQTVRRSARMKSEQYKKKKKSIDSDMHVDTQNVQEELQRESSKNKQNSVSDNNKVMEKKNKKMSKTKTMELKIFRDKNILKEKENLKRTNEKYKEIDEYRCASGLVNFIIEHIQKKKDKENFDDLLKYILKLINIYKIKTIDFVEAFLLLETINVNIITEYPIEEWILVTFHFLKGNTIEQNFNLIIKSLKLNSVVIGNVTASFYMNKKTIRMTEKNMNRILTILSNVVRRRSSRIKTFNRPNQDKRAKEDQQKDELLGSCWQPVEGGAQGK
ncbi:hypothetical protein AK88_04769 [Plasmodium fragile]|uniref:MI domain-containing protein n=1 Tax=Plasmodium fragile TaxID=5857 RepID=A0A0D9QFM7_PLAFR|nr:uncharacterized protein AK88_04769 [Plasmodium fragile]KJP85602.1 hypothetical protein AK88_04769 [Plasmodium fragile]